MEAEHGTWWRRGSPRYSYGARFGQTAFRTSFGELAMAARRKTSMTRREPTAEPQLIGALPKEVGALLIVAGIGGLLLPGPIGSPFLLLGGVTLWPKLFRKLEASFQRRFPAMHRQGMRQVKRFLDDLERRYPSDG